MLIKITDYNAVKIDRIDHKASTVIFRWIEQGQESRTHRARIRQDSNGKRYFNSYKLKIAMP